MRPPEAPRWKTNRVLFGGDCRYENESGFFRSDKPEGGPVEFAVTTRDTRDQPITDHTDRWHRGARLFRLGKCEAHILEYEGQDEAGRVDLPCNLVAVDLVRTSAKHGARHDLDERSRIQSTFSDHGNDFSEHFQGGRAHHVAEQLEEVCVPRVGADRKSPLP